MMQVECNFFVLLKAIHDVMFDANNSEELFIVSSQLVAFNVREAKED